VNTHLRPLYLKLRRQMCRYHLDQSTLVVSKFQLTPRCGTRRTFARTWSTSMRWQKFSQIHIELVHGHTRLELVLGHAHQELILDHGQQELVLAYAREAILVQPMHLECSSLSMCGMTFSSFSTTMEGARPRPQPCTPRRCRRPGPPAAAPSPSLHKNEITPNQNQIAGSQRGTRAEISRHSRNYRWGRDETRRAERRRWRAVSKRYRYAQVSEGGGGGELR
jgi:hypothetical protein